MYQADPKIDPLVEILRLAYRRGLAIRQEQEHSTEQTPQKATLPVDFEEQKNQPTSEKEQK
jgi:hypothetical protein